MTVGRRLVRRCCCRRRRRRRRLCGARTVRPWAVKWKSRGHRRPRVVRWGRNEDVRSWKCTFVADARVEVFRCCTSTSFDRSYSYSYSSSSGRGVEGSRGGFAAAERKKSFGGGGQVVLLFASSDAAAAVVVDRRRRRRLYSPPSLLHRPLDGCGGGGGGSGGSGGPALERDGGTAPLPLSLVVVGSAEIAVESLVDRSGVETVDRRDVIFVRS